MKEIEFNIKFITPLLIGGANPWQVDPAGLTGKALRGCWRFWFRGMVGGMIKNIKVEELKQLESLIFGSAGNKDSKNQEIGAKFKMLIEGGNKNIEDYELGFTRTFKCKGKGCKKCNYSGKIRPKSKGYPENTVYSVKLIPRNNMSEAEIKVLIATIWLWGNLGAIGKRERRGFGSLILELKNETNPFSFDLNEINIDFPLKESFEYTEELEGHLQKGVSLVWKVYNQWIKEINFTTKKNLINDISSTPAPENSTFFILQSFEQIFVGNKSFIDIDAIDNFHGDSTCKGLGWAEKKNRMASPVFIRMHKIKKSSAENYLPVVTWCKQDKVNNKDPNNSALKYLKRNIDGQRVFERNLNGGSL